MSDYGTVYKINCATTGKVYVGQTVKRLSTRLSSHVSDANRRNAPHSKLWSAIRKYGRDDFTIAPLEACASEDELNEREAYWIEKLDAVRSGYNLTTGGYAPRWLIKERVVSVEQRRHHSELMSGRVMPPDVRQRISKAMKGRRLSEIHKANLRKPNRKKEPAHG